MHLPSEMMLYEGIEIDVLFRAPRTVFGDLFLICGVGAHPEYPPSSSIDFGRLSDLQFSQVDDFFGFRSLTDDGDDVAVWLYPLVDGEPVHHHEGPYDGVRLSYNVLRNPARLASHYLHCVQSFSDLAREVRYASQDLELGTPPDLSVVQKDIDAIIKFGLPVAWSRGRKMLC